METTPTNNPSGQNADQLFENVLEDAVRATGASERGHHALCNFWKLLNEGGTGLDTENWKTIQLLTQFCAAGRISLVLRALESEGCAGKRG